MSRGRRPDPLSLVADDIEVILIPKVESDAAFDERTQEVQEILKKVLLLARKKGRPSRKEEDYEQAA